MITGQRTEKLGCTRFRDGTQMTDRILSRHANAVIRDGDGASLFIDIDANFQVGIVTEQITLLQSFKAQLVNGV